VLRVLSTLSCRMLLDLPRSSSFKIIGHTGPKCLSSLHSCFLYISRRINIFSLVSVTRLLSKGPNCDSIHFVTSVYSGDPLIVPLNTEAFSHIKPPSAVTSAVLRDTIKSTSCAIDREFPN